LRYDLAFFVRSFVDFAVGEPHGFLVDEKYQTA